MNTSVLIFHPLPSFCEGLGVVLSTSGFRCTDPRSVAVEEYLQAQERWCAVVSLDYERAWETIREVVAVPTSTVVALVPPRSQAYLILQLLRLNVDGLALADDHPSRIRDLLLAAWAGDYLVSKATLVGLAQARLESELTAAEVDILQALASGVRVTEAAELTHVSTRTAHRCIRSALAKLGVLDARSGISAARQLGLIS